MPDRLPVADRLAVDDLLACFVDAVARRDRDGLRALFTDGAVVEGPTEPPRVGADAIMTAMCEAFRGWDAMVIVPHAHLVTTDPDDPDTVRVRWYLSEIGSRAGHDVLYAGVYHDVLARHGDGWRFAHRRFDLLYARTERGPVIGRFPT